MAIDKVERFTAEINKIADKKVKKYETEAEAYLKKEVEALEEEMKQKVESKLKFETDRIHSATNRQITELENDSKKEISKKRREIQREVFVEVRKKVEEFVSSADYKAFLERSIKALASEIGGKVVVYARSCDIALVSQIASDIAQVLSVEKSDEIELGGVFASDEEKAYFVYDTLDSRMDTCAENFLSIADLSV